MNKPYLKPLCLAISATFMLSACGKSEQATAPAPAKPTTAATQAARQSR